MKKTNKILAIFLAILMVMYFVPFTSFRVLAVGIVSIQLNGAENYGGGTNSGNVSCANGNNVDISADASYNATGSSPVILEIERGSKVTFTPNGNQPEIWVNGVQVTLTGGSYVFDTSTITGNAITIDLNFGSNTGGGGGTGQPPQIGGTDNIDFNINFTGTNMIVQINRQMVMDDQNGPKNSFIGTIQNAGSANQSDTNILEFQPCFGDKPIAAYEINGITYTKNSPEALSYDSATGRIEIEVPGAASYTITGTADQNYIVPRTIIWVNPDYVPTDPANAQWVKDFTIDHGYARAIEVYDENNTKLNPRDYINTIVQPDGSSSDEYGLNKGFGWVKVMPGSRVVFEFVPDYGYQLTSISINERPLEAIDASTNRFEIVLPNNNNVGNLHFAATFTKTDDIVKAESTKVSSGSIELGNTLSGGTAQLVVDDVDLSSDKITAFTNAAGDYRISNYFDINLNQVFYKGKADSDDVWSNEITELENEATITLKLEDGVNGNEVVIVHEKHDGTYEVIPCTYDATTNTITFKTSSFSNYAIASKTVETTNPKTGDSIMMYTAIFALAILGTVGVVKVRKNLKK